jgi:putative FmdB family regulatory protein
MPVYEFYCEPCDGVFEALRPMREAADPVPCPECNRDARRIMPTSFAAFTFREGYPRRLPDRGTYWHMGKEVKHRIKNRFRAWEHPELAEKKPPPRKTKGEVDVESEKQRLRREEFSKMRKSGVRPSETKLPGKLREIKRRRASGPPGL